MKSIVYTIATATLTQIIFCSFVFLLDHHNQMFISRAAVEWFSMKSAIYTITIATLTQIIFCSFVFLLDHHNQMFISRAAVVRCCAQINVNVFSEQEADGKILDILCSFEQRQRPNYDRPVPLPRPWRWVGLGHHASNGHLQQPQPEGAVGRLCPLCAQVGLATQLCLSVIDGGGLKYCYW